LIDSKFIEIELSQEVIEKAQSFSEKVVHTDVYAFRNGQFNQNRRREQHFSSKLAEFAIYQFLLDNKIIITEPDCSIKQAGDKSWDPDLKVGNDKIPLHVKSQDLKSKENYGLSWIGEKSDKELYINCTGYVALCSVDTDKNIVTIYSLIETKFLKENNLFGETKLPKHREKKFAIYYKDLEKYDLNTRWKLLND
jgi:hypothetical protein